MPAERVHLGHRLSELTDRGDHVEARFANGARVTVDVLVGADGIHSVVRRALFGPEEPHFTGCVAYRGLVPAERLRDLELEVTAQVWMGPGRHFVHYFVSQRRLVNFVAIIEQDTWTRESWTERGDVADALRAFEGWHPQVRTILGSVDETFIWGLFDRQPLERWSAGRVTLLGDACHPMVPFMAQGAAQAIEDGATLTACLARSRVGHPGGAAAVRAAAPPPGIATASDVDGQQDRASICPTARNSRSATGRWPPTRPTGRSTPWRGSTSTTPRCDPRNRVARPDLAVTTVSGSGRTGSGGERGSGWSQ